MRMIAVVTTVNRRTVGDIDISKLAKVDTVQYEHAEGYLIL